MSDIPTTDDPRLIEHANSHCVSSEIEFRYDLENAPHNQKMTLLTVYGIAVEGFVTGDPNKDRDIMGFFPLPARNREIEEQLKAEGKYPWTSLVIG